MAPSGHERHFGLWMRSVLYGLTLSLAVCANNHTIAPALAEDGPWRLSEAIGLPDWLSLGGTHRTRFETLDGQFRAGRNGGDQVLVLRTTLLGEFHLERLRLGAEFMDSRAELADAGTPLNTGFVDVAELLQAYALYTADDWIESGSTTEIKGGRITMDVGSRRLVARNRFRNTINAFTGIDVTWTGADGRQARALLTLPIDRRPKSFAELIDNKQEFDTETADVVFWGAYFGMPALPWGGKGEVYVLGLHESDSADRPTRNRRLYTPGVRVYRPPNKSAFDYEIESVFQFGTSRTSTAATDTTDLNHFAHFQHVELGYSFAAPWSPRLVGQFDYASGDAEPTDDDNGRFDTLFGVRRFDFGPLGIYGPFARANIITPGIRLQMKPHPRVTGFVAHRAFWLAEKQDAWTTAGVRDAAGATDGFIGQQIEARVRWNILPGEVQLEAGAAHLFEGDFISDAPNANGQGDATYAYLQLALTF